METKTNIYTKLLAFQKLGISVKKDGANPHFKSKYATLNEVLDKVKEPLNKLGVLIIFQPNELGMQTALYDVDSNTQIVSFMKYTNCDTPQKVLSCNTYYRRGSLVSLLGLEDEDDDGNHASQPVKQAPKKMALSDKGLATAIDRIKTGDAEIYDNLVKTFNITPAQQLELDKLFA